MVESQAVLRGQILDVVEDCGPVSLPDLVTKINRRGLREENIRLMAWSLIPAGGGQCLQFDSKWRLEKRPHQGHQLDLFPKIFLEREEAEAAERRVEQGLLDAEQARRDKLLPWDSDARTTVIGPLTPIDLVKRS